MYNLKGPKTCFFTGPSVKLLDGTQDWVLQCSVFGSSPKPELQWMDSSRNILPAKKPQITEKGGKYDVILQTTVTKTDTYTCVSTQEENQTEAEIFVRVNGEFLYIIAHTVNPLRPTCW